MICKKCMREMSRIDHRYEGGKFYESYKCSECKRWCEGRLVKDSLTEVTWHQDNEQESR
ncbi:hypothetical protein J28TS4_04990 [Paenibacillus lautus]|nr:hypothetical protein J28TS4_04990 [Paenibacillus lautus]